jgi:hypothetical protein
MKPHAVVVLDERGNHAPSVVERARGVGPNGRGLDGAVIALELAAHGP